MSDQPEEPCIEDWPQNYFNYFTEIEEHFQRARGTGIFLLSPLDWALIESWKSAGVPLEAVLKGIDDAFQKWHSRKVKSRAVNSVAYCAQAVMEAAQRAPSRTGESARHTDSVFAATEVSAHLGKASAALMARNEAPFHEIAASLDGLNREIEEHLKNIEDLEQRLTALEDKMVSAARTVLSDEDLLAMRQSLDAELKPYRGKMTAPQLSMLERRYLDSAVLERARLPRLSLFYLA
jgi:flagellar motility protein MotE (MotC chaperone)